MAKYKYKLTDSINIEADSYTLAIEKYICREIDTAYIAVKYNYKMKANSYYRCSETITHFLHTSDHSNQEIGEKDLSNALNTFIHEFTENISKRVKNKTDILNEYLLGSEMRRFIPMDIIHLKIDDILPDEYLNVLKPTHIEALQTKLDDFVVSSKCDHQTNDGRLDGGFVNGRVLCRKCGKALTLFNKSDLKIIHKRINDERNAVDPAFTFETKSIDGIPITINGEIIDDHQFNNEELDEFEYNDCISWVKDRYEKSERIHKYNSSDIARKLFNDIGVDLSHNQVKHLMLICGYKPIDWSAGYWQFYIRLKH